jgi:hypothetical protein
MAGRSSRSTMPSEQSAEARARAVRCRPGAPDPAWCLRSAKPTRPALAYEASERAHLDRCPPFFRHRAQYAPSR